MGVADGEGETATVAAAVLAPALADGAVATDDVEPVVVDVEEVVGVDGDTAPPLIAGDGPGLTELFAVAPAPDELLIVVEVDDDVAAVGAATTLVGEVVGAGDALVDTGDGAEPGLGRGLATVFVDDNVAGVAAATALLDEGVGADDALVDTGDDAVPTLGRGVAKVFADDDVVGVDAARALLGEVVGAGDAVVDTGDGAEPGLGRGLATVFVDDDVAGVAVATALPGEVVGAGDAVVDTGDGAEPRLGRGLATAFVDDDVAGVAAATALLEGVGAGEVLVQTGDAAELTLGRELAVVPDIGNNVVTTDAGVDTLVAVSSFLDGENAESRPTFVGETVTVDAVEEPGEATRGFIGTVATVEVVVESVDADVEAMLEDRVEAGESDTGCDCGVRRLSPSFCSRDELPAAT